MDHKVFIDIIEKLDKGEKPCLTVSEGGKDHIRRFIGPDRLILLGGGHVSLDVYRFALMLDFDIAVVDDRQTFANSSRFPEALVICDSFENAIKKLEITNRDYVCVLTRGHKWDRMCIETILSGTMPYYLGMISSHRRAQGLKELLLEQGFDRERIDSIHAPIGLDIGAATTAEIAVSICSELISEKRRERYVPVPYELSQNNVDRDTLEYLAYSDDPRAFLLVLSSSGSTPVKSGSMMAVDSLGNIKGTIGGGCSEAAALVKARRIIGTGGSAVMNIDMSDDAAAENGMVCGGEMTVYMCDVT